MGWLDNQVALVTGGGSGIGHGIVSRFIEEGARVGIMERVADRVEQLRTDFGNAVFAVQGEVTRPADNVRAVDETVRAFGQLDIFVGNAGLRPCAPTPYKPERRTVTSIGISTSGRSENVRRAAATAREFGMLGIALTGRPASGLGPLADIESCTLSDSGFADRVQERQPVYAY